ncbi:MAG: hypothetical protein ACJA0Z_004614 [Halioglobus sp.]|jgi:hypothetical protein
MGEKAPAVSPRFIARIMATQNECVTTSTTTLAVQKMIGTTTASARDDDAANTVAMCRERYHA